MEPKDLPRLYALLIVVLAASVHLSAGHEAAPSKDCQCRNFEWLDNECKSRFAREATLSYAELIRQLNTSIHQFADLDDAFLYVYPNSSNVTALLARKFLKRLANAKRIKHFEVLFAKLQAYIKVLRTKPSIANACCKNYRLCLFDYMGAKLNYAHVLMDELLVCRHRNGKCRARAYNATSTTLVGDKMDLLSYQPNSTDVTQIVNLDYTVFHLYKMLNSRLRDFVKDKKLIKCEPKRRRQHHGSNRPRGGKRCSQKGKTPPKKAPNKVPNKAKKKAHQAQRGLKKNKRVTKSC